jgi:hypothetical protein
MNEPDHSPSRTWLWTTIILAVPVLYVLSIGPAFYYVEKNGTPRPTPAWLENFYEPVVWMHDQTPLKKPLELYVDWWVHLAHKT